MQINLAPDLSLLAIVAIFLATYFVVRRFLIRPINDILIWRETEIRSAEKRYEEALSRFNDETRDMESRLHDAKREGSQLRDQRRNEAAGYKNELLQKTRSEAEAITMDAESKVEKDVATARDTILRDSEMLARLTAERILGRKLS
ncbi:MAG: ATP synthase F0 subunit B [Thermoanaerobaculia bacterium]